jgi:hypothetical protein
LESTKAPAGLKHVRQRLRISTQGKNEKDFHVGDGFGGRLGLFLQEFTDEDPYIRAYHQIVNFLRFCETAVRIAKPKRILLVTTFDNTEERDDATAKLATIIDSLNQFDVQIEVRENARLHDRQVRLSNG